MTIKLPTMIALDLDNTLYSYPSSHRDGMAQVASVMQNQLGLSRGAWLPAFESARTQVKERLGETASSHSRLLYFKAMLENLGIGSYLDLALQLESNYWQTFIRSMTLADGSLEFLELCRAKGIPVVVMTDLTLQVQLRKIVYLNLLTLIHAVVTSEEVGQDKPSTYFMKYARETLKVDTREAWVIGDDNLRDGGLAEASGSKFFHVSASERSKHNFTQLSRQIGLLAR